MRGRRGGAAAWERTWKEPGRRIFQTDWASPTPLPVQKPRGWQQPWGCPDKLYLSLKLGRAGWGTKMSQGAGLWFSHQGMQKRLGILDHSLAGPLPVVTPSPEALVSRDSTLAHQEHSASLLALLVSISSLQGVRSHPPLLPLVVLPPFLWAVVRGRLHAGNWDR